MILDLSSGQTWVMVLNLVIAAFLGGLIGLEREAGHRPAGLRTTMLVCVGSALFTVLSLHAFPSAGDVSDARVAAQIVSGIGFLGAATVWRAQDHVKGLTTAATIWVAAAIGMAVGSGLGLLALAATLITLFILTLMQRVERRFFPHVGEHSAPDQKPS